jgi:hypothetical protein
MRARTEYTPGFYVPVSVPSRICRQEPRNSGDNNVVTEPKEYREPEKLMAEPANGCEARNVS